MEETWGHVCVQRQQVNFQLRANSFMCWMPVGIPGSQSRTHNSVTHYWIEHDNHSIMTHPSKTDWHYPYSIIHPAQQRADSGQEIFSTRSLNIFLYGDMRHDNCYIYWMPGEKTKFTRVSQTAPLSCVGSSALTIQPRLIHQTQIGTSRIASLYTTGIDRNRSEYCIHNNT